MIRFSSHAFNIRWKLYTSNNKAIFSYHLWLRKGFPATKKSDKLHVPCTMYQRPAITKLPLLPIITKVLATSVTSFGFVPFLLLDSEFTPKSCVRPHFLLNRGSLHNVKMKRGTFPSVRRECCKDMYHGIRRCWSIMKFQSFDKILSDDPRPFANWLNNFGRISRKRLRFLEL